MSTLPKLLLPLVLLALAACLAVIASFGSNPITTSVQLIPTDTPPYIPAVLMDTGEKLYCYLSPQAVVGTPHPNPIFQTATALASISPSPSPTPTATTIPLQTRTPTLIWQTPSATGTFATPTIEFWQLETETTPTMIVLVDMLNVRSCAGKGCLFIRTVKHGDLLAVTSITQTADGFVWRMLTSGEWVAQEVVGGTKYLQ